MTSSLVLRKSKSYLEPRSHLHFQRCHSIRVSSLSSRHHQHNVSRLRTPNASSHKCSESLLHFRTDCTHIDYSNSYCEFSYCGFFLIASLFSSRCQARISSGWIRSLHFLAFVGLGWNLSVKFHLLSLVLGWHKLLSLCAVYNSNLVRVEFNCQWMRYRHQNCQNPF